MSYAQRDERRHVCIVNVGLFRSGTTTLSEAAKRLGLTAYRKFPDLSQEQYKQFLYDPDKVVLHWSSNSGFKEIIQRAREYDMICDGWCALLPFLPTSALDRLKREAEDSGVQLEFVASTRDVESTVKSELQHWTIHDLESKAGLTGNERESLEHKLRERAVEHRRRVQQLFDSDIVKVLPLVGSIHQTWSTTLSTASEFTRAEWSDALYGTGIRNANPPLPLEGILLTLRLGSDKEADDQIASIDRLLERVEKDSLCQYLVVLSIDADQAAGTAATKLVRHISSRAGSQQQQMKSFHEITNPPKSHGKPFAICSAWDEMATVAWENGADWVVLLGDDVEVDCSYHYRAFYRSFLDIEKRLKVPFGFGCPWWNDTAFPGFSSFPCVGKAHYDIFGGLIPAHRRSSFVNQDLDPYLQRLYIKFDAAPCVHEARLSNGAGGHVGSGEARYERIPCEGWRDFVVDDIEPIRKYLPHGAPEVILLDVIVPSFRVRLDYLQSICSLRVPEYIRGYFLIIVDNPDELLRKASVIAQSTDTMALDQAERILEDYLSQSGNNVRVRCNKTNVGASASRNRGLHESSAEFVLNLDDDLVPNPNLLEQYGRKLQEIDDTVVGLIGLVQFPRSPTLPLKHAAVLMSYLTFMFEIAKQDLYTSPAWGVTANILFRRTRVRFDLTYAKTGGGEDVDFSLRVTEESNGGKLLTVPEACVVHPFWPGSVLTLCSHFFNWAVGDGGLLQRFPEYCYWSFPNLPETLLLVSPLCLWFGPWNLFKIIPSFLAADFVVDFINRAEYQHRCSLLQERRSRLFYFFAHILANLYVVVLECGRLWGHVTRKDGYAWSVMCHRFDWHCGRLANAPRNFRKREAFKFGLFVVILLNEFGVLARPWSMLAGTCAA